MGLLDSDAEELKKNKTGEASSGRKVNQSGLGALRGLSKYSNLTAKYRTTGKDEATEKSDSVEHSRGTFSKSVQSECNVVTVDASFHNNHEDSKVGANSVQSQGDNLCFEPSSTVTEGNMKSVQSECKSNVPLGHLEAEVNSFQCDVENIEVGAKSVQISSIGNVDACDEVVDNAVSAGSIKSVQSQCVSVDKIDASECNDVLVSAKSVQDIAKLPNNFGTISSNETNFTTPEYSAETPCKLSANDSNLIGSSPNEQEEGQILEASNSVQTQCKVGAEMNSPQVQSKNNKVSANPAQSRCNSGEKTLLGKIIKTSKKSVQTQCNEIESENVFKVASVNSKVSAKPVQAEREVRAAKLDNLEIIDPSKTKVIPKSLLSSEPTESIISISGSQRIIVDFLFQTCLWNNSLISPPITKQQLISGTGLLEETALSSIKRLRKKNIIDRYAYKDGKAGWTQYQFSESSYKELLHIHQVSAKSVQSQLPTLDSNRSVSGHPMAFKNGLNNFAPPVNKIGKADQGWFKNLDFSKIHPIGPMMVNPAIRSMIEEKLTPDVVQDFINRFTSWTSTQGRITSPIGLFCDKLKGLVKEGDSPVFSFMTEEERQAEAVFAAQVEKARVEMELIQKSRIELATKEANSTFENWYNSSSDSEKFLLAQPNSFAPVQSEAYKRILKAAYLEKTVLK